MPNTNENDTVSVHPDEELVEWLSQIISGVREHGQISVLTISPIFPQLDELCQLCLSSNWYIPLILDEQLKPNEVILKISPK
jgi:hypothetical protein